MSSPSERLAAVKAAPRRTLDVEILLDSDLAEKRKEVQSRLSGLRDEAARDPRLTGENPAIAETQAELDALIEESVGAVATLRFKQLPGSVWADISGRCPVRVDAELDTHYGYNMHKAAMLAAPLSGVWVVDGEEIPLRVENATQDTPAVDEWADLFATCAGSEAVAIHDAIFDLNVYGPQVRIYDAKKALATRPA